MAKQTTIDLTVLRTNKDKPYKLETWQGKGWALASALAGTQEADKVKLANSIRRLASTRDDADVREHYSQAHKALIALTDKVTTAQVNSLKQLFTQADAADDAWRKAQEPAPKAKPASKPASKPKTGKQVTGKDDKLQRRLELLAMLKASVGVGVLTPYETACADMLINKLSE